MICFLLIAAIACALLGILAVYCRFHSGWLICFSSVLIAIGGAVATFGWNEISSRETRLMLEENRQSELRIQRETIVRALAAELTVNLSVINDKAYTESGEEQLSRFVVYPRFQTTVLAGVIASGLFVGEQDREFFTRVADLHSRLTDANERLSLTELKMAMESKSLIPSARKAINDSIVRRDLKARLVRIAQLLIGKYGISTNDTFFIDLDPQDKSPK